jgi:hypothetical protein
MEMEQVPEMLYLLNHLTWLIAQEDYIKSCRPESFKTYIMHLYGEDINRKIRLLENLRPEDGDGASPRNVVSFKSSDTADGPRRLY